MKDSNKNLNNIRIVKINSPTMRDTELMEKESGPKSLTYMGVMTINPITKKPEIDKYRIL